MEINIWKIVRSQTHLDENQKLYSVSWNSQDFAILEWIAKGTASWQEQAKQTKNEAKLVSSPSISVPQVLIPLLFKVLFKIKNNDKIQYFWDYLLFFFLNQIRILTQRLRQYLVAIWRFREITILNTNKGSCHIASWVSSKDEKDEGHKRNCRESHEAEPSCGLLNWAGMLSGEENAANKFVQRTIWKIASS